jgi:hypothetical protein
MANLWRILAVAWLGGVASPALAAEPANIEVSIAAIEANDPGAAVDKSTGEPAVGEHGSSISSSGYSN